MMMFSSPICQGEAQKNRGRRKKFRNKRKYPKLLTHKIGLKSINHKQRRGANSGEWTQQAICESVMGWEVNEFMLVEGFMLMKAE